MRFLVIILCITGFLAKDIARISWEIWFKVNQEQIIAEKCENKAIPMMHCNGKCYLSKQLKKLEEKEADHNGKTNPFSQSVKADWIVEDRKITPEMPIAFSSEKSSFPAFISGKVTGYSNFTFHPPA